MFQKKLHQEQARVAEDAAVQQVRKTERTGLLAEVEPKLTALVMEVFGVLEEAGANPMPVWPMHVRVRNHVAFALHPFSSVGQSLPVVQAAVVIDCRGMLAFNHRIETKGEWPSKLPVSTGRLDEAHETILNSVARTDAPKFPGIHLSSAGELMLCTSSGNRDEVIRTSEPLEVFLARHAARTVAAA